MVTVSQRKVDGRKISELYLTLVFYPLPNLPLSSNCLEREKWRKSGLIAVTKKYMDASAHILKRFEVQ
jgi:hypothetical protein